MAKEKQKSVITTFTPEGDYLAILSPDGTVKVWNTSNGNQLAKWKESCENSEVTFSCMACSFLVKKHRKEQGTCLVALGTDGGDVSVLNISIGQIMWKSSRCNPGTVHLFYTNEGNRLLAVSTTGMVSEMNPKTGEVTKEFKISKKSISAAVCPSDDKIIAAVGNKIIVSSLEDGSELLKFSSNLGHVQCVFGSDDAKFIVASGVGEKHFHAWKCDFTTKTVSDGTVVSMRHPPLGIECKNGFDGEDSLIVLSVLEAGVAYLWNMKSVSEDVSPTKITVRINRSETDPQKSGRAKKNRLSIIAARIHAFETDGQVRALICFGSVDSPQFTLLDNANPGEDIVVAASDMVEAVAAAQDNGVHVEKGVPNQKGKAKHKRAASDMDVASGVPVVDNDHDDPTDGIEIDNDLNEPTMGEKLVNLGLEENNESKGHENLEAAPRTKPPSADSVHVLLKQALHADDQGLLIDCLYRQDEKVVANSVSQLNPSDVLKLLQSLISIIQSRGAVLACALPWLRSLLLQHASGIMSQQSSLIALNTLYQLIDSRVSTFNQALKLSSFLDLLYAGNVDGEDINDTVTPVIFEDKDGSDEDVDSMETESVGDDKEPEILSGISDFEEME